MTDGNGQGKPSQSGGNGYRDKKGRFLPGNPGGVGNPYAKRREALKAAMFANVHGQDIATIIRSMIAEAVGGDVQAAKLVLEYTIGKPKETYQFTGGQPIDWGSLIRLNCQGSGSE